MEFSATVTSLGGRIDWSAINTLASWALVFAAIFAGATAWNDLKHSRSQHRAQVAELKRQVELAARTLRAQMAAHVVVDIEKEPPPGIPQSAQFAVEGRALFVTYENLGFGPALGARVRIWARHSDRLPTAHPTSEELDAFGDPNWISDHRDIRAGGSAHPFLTASPGRSLGRNQRTARGSPLGDNLA